MYAAWLASEHSRIHLIEQWPSGPRREAALAAARSTLDSFCFSARIPMDQRFIAWFATIGGTARRSSSILCGFNCAILQMWLPSRSFAHPGN